MNEADFPQTSWTLVARARSEAGGESLEKLVAQYVPALRNYLTRALRVDLHDAEDIVQGFIAAKVIERRLLETADASRGRLRTFLASALRNYLIDTKRQQFSRLRAEQDASRQVQVRQAPDDGSSFDSEWARTILEQTVARLRRHFEASGRPQTWRAFELRILIPIRDGTPTPCYDMLVEQIGFRSATEACSTVTTAKRAFARILREVIADTVEAEVNLEDEIGYLHEILAASRSIAN